MEEAMATAKASFRRCCASPGFFAAFYSNFFGRCPEAKPMFAETDFERQYKLLQHGLYLLLIFPGEPETDESIMARVADRHSRRDLDVDPTMYPKWVDAMIDTVREYDTQFSAEVENAWRKSMAPGIEYMRARY